MINHCGPGTYLTTARHGVPQLHVPWDFDEPELARRAASTGASITLHGVEVTGQTIRDHVQWLLDDDDFRRAAGELREDLHAMPTPNELVGRLEQLATKYRR
jgi:UDP:flavonoid glycosyltransferase YjiC (YdhE family)